MRQNRLFISTPNTYQCHCSPTKKVFHCFPCFVLLLARCRLFQRAIAGSLSFHCLQAMKSQNILTCNFSINQLLKRRVRVSIRQDSFFELQSGAVFTTKWGNNYKVVQYRRRMKETKEIDFGNLLLYSALFAWRQTPRNS